MMLRVWALENAELITSGLNADGENALGLNADGLNADGENALGLNAEGPNADGENALGLNADALPGRDLELVPARLSGGVDVIADGRTARSRIIGPEQQRGGPEVVAAEAGETGRNARKRRPRCVGQLDGQ